MRSKKKATICLVFNYRILRKFDEFDESWSNRQTKTIQYFNFNISAFIKLLSHYNCTKYFYNISTLRAFHQTLFRQNPESENSSNFNDIKLSQYMVVGTPCISTRSKSNFPRTILRLHKLSLYCFVMRTRKTGVDETSWLLILPTVSYGEMV